MLALFTAWSAAYAGPEMIPMAAYEIVGQPAPGFVLDERGGGSFDLSKHQGRVVVISFWASWCGPCRGELPAMSAVATTRTDVDWIAVNVDRHPQDTTAFLSKVDVGIPIAWDSAGQALGDYGVLSMPTSFVIDKHGVVAFKKIGFSQEKGLTELMTQVDAAVKAP
jgi:thiol-disulfide isomerase/thioredoxin